MNQANSDRHQQAMGLLTPNDPYKYMYTEAAITTDGVRVPFLVEVDGKIIPVGSVRRIPEHIDITEPLPLQFKRYSPQSYTTTINFNCPYSTLEEDGVLQPYQVE
ncbi:hypothetical protein I6H07_13290 [Hafnia alvei]|uniref:hypothetical protein n=1 Tax=Hafnia alvei TaxID=569 RepID=UPI000B6DA3D7|nr:hypothetical protein [Hafnia alvei]MBI0276750.1 hypothetical protein [Hafnia alvei]PNK99799.1 hypothetical protein CEQ28_020515 [Hafnia alvei]